MTDELRPFELRYHSAIPNWCVVTGLTIKPVPKSEGGGFMVARKQAERIVADATERARLEGEVARLREACAEAAQQIEYLHDKFTATGSGNAVLARLKEALRHD